MNLNDAKPFDRKAFDKLVAEICPPLEEESDVKFLIVSGIIYVFPESGLHNGMYYQLRNNLGLSEKPQCAGRINVYFDKPDDGSFGARRILFDHSLTLRDAGLVSFQDSDKYKIEVVGSKLGKFFKIS